MNKLLFVPFLLVSSSYAMDAKIALEKVVAQGELFESVGCGFDEDILTWIAKGADPNCTVCKGFTYLQMAVTNKDTDTVKALVKGKAKVNACGKDGFTALHDAVMVKNAGIIIFLLLHGADIHAKVYDGTTALHMAAEGGHYVSTLLLLESEAEVNVTNDLGRTPLFDAVAFGNRKVVQLLIEKGAKANIHGCTFVSQNGRKKRKVRISPLHMAVALGDKDIICQLLNAGALINSKSDDGYTPLDYAIKVKHKTVQRLLVAKGAKMAHELLPPLEKRLAE